ncbi:phosphoribosylglycinamide formyltransferase, partial [bacterium]|nr:phosphoribosylglycinamide formyltransferase [bacterium]
MIRATTLFSGNGTNLESILQECNFGILKGLYKIPIVITDNPNAIGIKRASDFNVKIEIIDSECEILELIKKYKIDFIILAGYKKILSRKFKRYFDTKKVINIHPADTNLFKGLGGYEWAFKNSLKTTKITVHFVDEGVDTGEIISQKEIDISNCKTVEEIINVGLSIEHKFYPET